MVDKKYIEMVALRARVREQLERSGTVAVLHARSKKINSIVKILKVGDFEYPEINCKMKELKTYELHISKLLSTFPKDFLNCFVEYFVNIQLCETVDFGKTFKELANHGGIGLIGEDYHILRAKNNNDDFHTFVFSFNFGGKYLNERRTPHNGFYYVKFSLGYRIKDNRGKFGEDKLISTVSFFFKKQSNGKPDGCEVVKSRFWILSKPDNVKDIVIGTEIGAYGNMDLIEFNTRRIKNLNIVSGNSAAEGENAKSVEKKKYYSSKRKSENDMNAPPKLRKYNRRYNNLLNGVSIVTPTMEAQKKYYDKFKNGRNIFSKPRFYGRNLEGSILNPMNNIGASAGDEDNYFLDNFHGKCYLFDEFVSKSSTSEEEDESRVLGKRKNYDGREYIVQGRDKRSKLD